ncbi:MAG: peptidase S8 and S53 subtilisin kexin sedolisin, partial [Hyphomicrobiales bacterium]|nr:peptidase S8 and S53 subtilisin kexin sedolisin [Hyphomicrobiales bacterium]
MDKPLDHLTKLHSRLRCVANGDTKVNAVRAQQNGAVRVKADAGPQAVPSLDDVTLETTVRTDGTRMRGIKRRRRQRALSDDVEVNVFVLLDRESAETPDLVVRRNGRVGAATVAVRQLGDLDTDPSVQSIELAETLKTPDPRTGVDVPLAPPAGRFADLNRGEIPVPGGEPVSLDTIGDNMMIGIIDVGGLDFAHPDFMDDAGKTRILRIWDQGGDTFAPPELTVSGPGSRRTRSYGSEITADDIEFALAEASAARASPYDLAPQSQQIRGSHATHVTSIAAGRSGVCKRAKIAAVLVSLPEAALDRSKSFYDTTRIVDGIAYLFALAEAKGMAAISINISLGTNGGAHDGSELMSRWIDTAMPSPGRAGGVAAGNSGQEAPQFEGDFGHWSGRVHASGRIPAAALR